MKRYKRAARDRIKELSKQRTKEFTKFGTQLTSAQKRLDGVVNVVDGAKRGFLAYRDKAQSELNNIDRLFETDSQRAEFEINREKKASLKEFQQQINEHEASGAA